MILERFRLEDKVAVVTGAGRGIGRAIALALGEAGARVVCAARTESQILDAAGEIKKVGSEALAVQCDVNIPEKLDNLVGRTLDKFGRVDILINNAGGSMPMLALHESVEAFEQAFHFNVTTAFMLTQKVIPHMLEQGGGSGDGDDGGAIVNISSALSHVVESGFVSYGTAKAALCHMTRLLAFEFAPRIRVNALAVGAVETDALQLVVADEGLKQKMVDLTPMGRLGKVEDVAAAALYLASPAAGWVTGKVFEIDGGAPGSTWPMKFEAF